MRVGDLCRLRVAGNAAVGARHHGNAEPFRGALGLDLVAHQADMLGLGADELHGVFGEDFGKTRVLREEAVAGMHGVGAGDLAGRENGGDVEVAVFRRRRPDADALVGKAHVHRVGVGGRMHRHRRDAELLAGAQDAQGDLAAIGDEDFIEHWAGSTKAPSFDDHQRLAEFDRLAVLEQDLHSRCRRASPESGSWSSSLR